MNITIIGAGNVATHLALALKEAGHAINQVYSRTLKSASILAEKINALPINKVELLNNDADLYIFSISDNALPELVKQIDLKNMNVVHTAGSIPIDVFKGAENYGVFYPLQTFSKKRKLDFREIPLCIEANNEKFNEKLTLLAKDLSDSVWQINSEQRKQLHLSAVFACNFVNHLYSISKELIKDKQVGFDILKPLIKETALKVMELEPKHAQTGPAVRNDTESLQKHIDLLSSYPEIQEIYKLLSKDIYLKNK